MGDDPAYPRQDLCGGASLRTGEVDDVGLAGDRPDGRTGQEDVAHVVEAGEQHPTAPGRHGASSTRSTASAKELTIQGQPSEGAAVGDTRMAPAPARAAAT